MRYYRISLTMANPEFNGTLNKFAEDIDSAVNFFNERSKYTRNPKGLRLIDIQDDICIVEMTSEKELPTPAKALRLFTQYLLDNSELRRYTYCGSLFRSIRVTGEVPASMSNPADPTEVQVMDRLTRLLIGQISGKNDCFSVIKTLLDCSGSMEEHVAAQYLATVERMMIEEAKKPEYGENSLK